MTRYEKVDKICEMFKELLDMDMIEESEIDKTYMYLKITIEAVKELQGEDENE